MQAARETGALKAAKDMLEKRVEELTWRLEFEKHLRVYVIFLYCINILLHHILVMLAIWWYDE